MTAPHQRRTSTPPTGPTVVSTAAAEQLSPAFPARAPWGTASRLRAWQAEALQLYLEQQPAGLPRRRHPRRRQDDVRPAHRHRAARPRRRAARHRRVPDRAPQDASGPTPPPGSGSSSTRASATPRAGTARASTASALTYAQVAANPVLHRNRTEAEPHARHPRRGPPRRRRAELGRRRARGVRARATPAARADRHAVPLGHRARSRSSSTSADADGIRRSQADYTYGYGDALRDGVVRPVIFLAYSGADALAHQGRRRGRRAGSASR